MLTSNTDKYLENIYYFMLMCLSEEGREILLNDLPREMTLGDKNVIEFINRTNCEKIFNEMNKYESEEYYPVSLLVPIRSLFYYIGSSILENSDAERDDMKPFQLGITYYLLMTM